MCPFVPRCQWAAEECRTAGPALEVVEPGRRTACRRIIVIRDAMRASRSAAERGTRQHDGSAPLIPLVSVSTVSRTFLSGRGGTVQALRRVSLAIADGESVGLVGESGSGKTTLGRCLVGLERPDEGSIVIDGIEASDYGGVAPDDRRRLRRTIQIVFQDPYSSLDPTQSVGSALREALALRPSANRGNRRHDVEELLARVGLPAAYAGRRPGSLSGGERQRVAIARALAIRPRILVCDEPVSSLDVSVQAQILRLFRNLQAELGIGYLFITHDLAVVRQVVDRLYVLYRGEIVEDGPVERVLDRPEHPYTQRLLDSLPRAADRSDVDSIPVAPLDPAEQAVQAGAAPTV
jgi:peptide/nickel transport system ATP-binding protein